MTTDNMPDEAAQELWISKEAIQLTLEDCYQGEGELYHHNDKYQAVIDENSRLKEKLTIFKDACDPSKLDHKALEALQGDGE